MSVKKSFNRGLILCKSFKWTLWPVFLPTFLADFELKILPSTSERFSGLALCLMRNLFRQDETQFTIERRGQITDQIQRTCMVKHRQNERLQKTKIHRLINPNNPNSDSAFDSCSITFPSVQITITVCRKLDRNSHTFDQQNRFHRIVPDLGYSVKFKIQVWIEKGF